MKQVLRLAQLRGKTALTSDAGSLPNSGYRLRARLSSSFVQVLKLTPMRSFVFPLGLVD